MESTTKNIVGFTVEQLSKGKFSVALEKIAFKKTLDGLLLLNLEVKIICTDRHVGIRKIMCEKYPKIAHEFDVWHLQSP